MVDTGYPGMASLDSVRDDPPSPALRIYGDLRLGEF